MKQTPTVYQVSELADEMRRLMETSYPEVWIEGELSSLSTPASGHIYFSLKDERSQLRCAMFKGRASISRYHPKVGDLVRVRCKISVYTARGDLQCIVQHMEEAGEGILQRRFEELKQALNQQGLFAQEHKQAIPKFAKHIGLITSPSGAAVRDIVTTLKRRCPGIPVTIYPAVVQGETAAKSIIQALRDALQHQQCDVLILSRGGGSLEDLWCFNDEGLAREIFASPIPIISGVGHEVDVTISDLVADLRAPTPTAAAEIVSPDTDQLIANIKSMQFRLPRNMERLLQRMAQTIDMTGRQLVHPKQQLSAKADKLNHASLRLQNNVLNRLARRRDKLGHLQQRIQAQLPAKRLQRNNSDLRALSHRLQRVQTQALVLSTQKFEALGGKLNAVSPLATLERGFSIARDQQHSIVRTTDAVAENDRISVQLSDGSLDCLVQKVR